MEKIGIVILAAGLGKRLGGELPKVLYRTSEKPLLFHVLDEVLAIQPERCVVVAGYKRELVERAVVEHYQASQIRFVLQSEQRGTGHAVQCAKEAFADFSGTVLIVCGDAPLLSAASLRQLLSLHEEKKATLTAVTACLENPAAYGRILREKSGAHLVGVREAKDCSASELLIKEVAQGSYAVDSAFLWPAVSSLKNNNSQNEFYLTDIVALAAKEGQRALGYVLPDAREALGVNDWYDLQRIDSVLNARRVERFMRSGVRMLQPESVFIDSSVQIAPGASIGPHVQLRGSTSLETEVVIDGNAVITDCHLARAAHLKLGVVAEGATIGPNSSVGPFAHLRAGTVLGAETKIGNFVETKKAVLAKGVKASHLTYLGDCSIGEDSNIGAGTITCNYDGYQKATTTIGSNVFIGSNSSLVAPVTIEDGATVGAGSVITQRVEKDALALTRASQESKPGWSKRKREAMKKRS